MRIDVLGPLAVRDEEGRPVEVGGTRLRALLVLLALQPGRLVTTEALIDGLWGDDPPGGATNALQSLVSRLRRAGIPVESKPAGYLLPIMPDDVDACRFEALVAAGRYDDAEREWRGEALADVLDAPFATAVATRLEDRRLDVAEHRALDLGELERLAAKHPLRETLHAKLVKALSAAGRQADALAAYERIRRALADELGVDPSPALAAVHLAVLRHDPSVAPPTPALTRTNLRASLTSFVGRETELERVGALLDETRLVTVFGPGGAGKTRFATELAGRRQADSPDGSWLVELAPVTNEDDLLQAVLSAMGIREAVLLESSTLEPRPLKARAEVARLVDAFATKRALLILDNCEHLVTAAARLAETLLASCPQLRILATSREPLTILGENVYPLPPLSWPTTSSDPTEALGHSAVRLFVDRAVAVRPDFALDEANLKAVLEICARLDGMPLAIELAAARLRSLAPAQIAARLDDRFRLLTGGSRTALPRHQTLRAVVEWSWDLLDEPERVLARRLSVFPAGATLESAELVCAAPDQDVLPILAALVDKAILVGTTDTGSEEMRYRMLETIRAYGAEQLAEAGELADVRGRHAVYFGDLIETADAHLRTREQLTWLARVRRDYGNVVAALRWALDTEDGDLAVRFGASMMWFWFIEGNRAESMALIDEIVTLPVTSHPEARASVLAFHGMMMLSADRFEEGRAIIGKAIADSRALDMTQYPLMLFLEGIVSVFDRDRNKARDTLTGLVDRYGGWERALALTFLGFVEGNEGNPDLSAAYLRRGFEAFAEVGDRWGMAAVRRAEAGDLSAVGDHEGAIAAYDEALQLVHDLNSVDDVAHMMSEMGLERARMGDLARGRAELEEALRFAEEFGQSEARHVALCGLAEVEMKSNDIPRARALLHRAFSELHQSERQSAGPPQAKALVLVGLATADVLERDAPMAAQRAREALQHGMVAFDMPVVSIAARIDAAVALLEGSPERAATLLGLAEAVRGGPLVDDNVLQTAARAREALGDEAYERAFATGRSQSRDDALASILPTE
ncbi:BTAD domain-containing putative transcriptional regulator [Tenggerimyces flavus]|uniref:BTAD domain-containing putative transcriptional regulator n=1 Tax=Tenggerimyces flavus TaxID=1708749 RepID=A0ABV7Y912_9ACTN|nr:BTAD domain-containing putative transcriptional regulator [Tenggerimyces flavus]MBM7785081.1 putative ATPase [Tenggerimyces flavus]